MADVSSNVQCIMMVRFRFSLRREVEREHLIYSWGHIAAILMAFDIRDTASLSIAAHLLLFSGLFSRAASRA